jgi:hypothetical protein
MKRFTWTIEVTVDETWVADGFDLTDSRAHDMVARGLLPWARFDEFQARVVRRPVAGSVSHAQGYGRGDECEDASCDACYGPEGYHRPQSRPRRPVVRLVKTERVAQPLPATSPLHGDE